MLSNHSNVCIFQCYFGRNKSCDERGQWKNIYNYMGVCYSYTLSIFLPLLLSYRQLITTNFRFFFSLGRRISNQHDRLIQQFLPEGIHFKKRGDDVMKCNNQLFVFKVQDNEPLAYKNDSSGWKLLIHDQRDSPLIHLRTHGTTLYRGWSKDIRVFIRQVLPQMTFFI
jgi:hypothetical protein